MSFLVGLIAGAFGGLVGLGGGVVMIPMMTRFLGIAQPQAHGTSLAVVVFAGISGAWAYAREGTVDISAALILAVTASLTARLGAGYSSSLPEWKLRRYFGCVLVAVAALLPVKPFLGAMAVMSLTGAAAVAALAATGLATGFIAGLLGIGGGAFLIAGMVLFVGMGQHTAQGSALLSMVPAAAVGAWAHWRLGNVATRIVPGLAAGIILGAFMGGTAANHLPEQTLRVLFSVVLVWLGVNLIRKSRPPSAKSP
ncbi:MAG: sulfite exporter TauE/SafE family protein [Syntrophaceae bacterium]|nr:sulfite exporter TauE/SafE family protein [Syntrophaceae bacterium]